jgi:hypothetical protein
MQITNLETAQLSDVHTSVAKYRQAVTAVKLIVSQQVNKFRAFRYTSKGPSWHSPEATTGHYPEINQ